MIQRKQIQSAIFISPRNPPKRYLFPWLIWVIITVAAVFTPIDFPFRIFLPINCLMLPMTMTSIIPKRSTISSFTLRTTVSSSSRRVRSMTIFNTGLVTPIALMKLPPRLDTEQYQQRQQSLRLFSSNVDTSMDDPATVSSLNTGKKRVVFLGSPPVAAESLHRIHEASQQADSVYDIVAVISQPPKRGKRGGKVEHTAVAQMAQQLNISTILTPDRANDTVFLQEFCQVRPDLCITAAYGQYLPKRFLQTPTYGTINIHPSLLPKWRGASPVQRSLEAGENPLGVTVLYTVSKMDAGPIIAQSTLEVQDHETTTTLLPKLFQIGTQSLINILPKVFDETITISTATMQNEDEVTYAKLIDTSEAEFKVWQETATSCHNRLRGFHMWPKAYMYIQITNPKNDSNDDPPLVIKLKIHETRVVSDLRLPPTDILQTSLPTTTGTTATNTTTTPATGLYVVCYDGSVLELIMIQPPSKTAYPARDLVHGYPNATIQWIRPEESHVDCMESRNITT